MFFTLVRTSETAIVERFYKAVRIAPPGLRFKWPLIERVHRVSNRQQESKFVFRKVPNSDNVFCDLHLSIQWRIKPQDSMKALYAFADPEGQMQSYVDNIAKSQIRTMTMNELLQSTDEITQRVSKELEKKLSESGITLVDTLIRSVDPDDRVRDAMNSVFAAEKQKEAAEHEAQAEWIRQVRSAEADKERRRLIGEGIAQQREAIFKGYGEAMTLLKGNGLEAHDSMRFISDMQHYDTIEHIGSSTGTQKVFLPLNNKLSTLTSLESSKDIE
jgi:regulator of protease activity HflC (stomatin/prohibitin superfamily)